MRCGARAASARRDPRAGLAYTLESHALLGLGRPGDALECLQALPADAPRDNDHHVALAVALQRCGRHDEAIRAFFDALALKMDDAVSHFRLGMSFKDLGMKAEAAECVRTAILLGLGSSDVAARAQLAFLEREACRWSEADAVLRDLRTAVRALPPDTAVETGAFPHAVLVDDPLEQLKVARHYSLHVMSAVRPLPRRAVRAHGGRLRIGYLSADFHQHATSQLMVQMLECHDRSAFEVTLLSTGPDDGSALRRRIVNAVEHFEELRGRSFESIAQRVRELGIDILVDLKGATYDTLLPVLAHRPAPLQVTWLGFPGTTGAPFIDYLIGDPVVSPLADADHFGEKIAQLPVCYQPNDARRALPAASTRAEWGVPDERAAAVRLPPVVQDLGRGVRLLVRAAARAARCGALAAAMEHQRAGDADRGRARARHRRRAPRVRAAAAAGGPSEPPRPRRRLPRRLAVQRPHHRRRGPVGRRAGRHDRRRRPSRSASPASLLHAVELDELVCADVERLRARRWSRWPPTRTRRAQLRTHLLAQRIASPLFDGARLAREIEHLYRRMWERAVCAASHPSTWRPSAASPRRAP